MPFEPLQTDEKMAQGAPREKTMDDLMLAGCSSFVSMSLGSFVIGVWPFFAFQDNTGWTELLRTVAIGLIPNLIFGIVASRKFGLPGACGFVGGGLAIAVFLLLNTTRLLNLAALPGTPPPFPAAMIYIIPAVWVLLVVGTALVTIPRSELPGHDDPTPES